MALPASPKFTCWNFYPPWDAVRKWGLWEVMKSGGGARVNGLPAFINDTRRGPRPLPTQQGGLCLWTRELALTRHGTHQHLDLGLPRSVNCEEMSVLYNPPAPWPFVIAIQANWDSHRPCITNLRELFWEELLSPNKCLRNISCFHYCHTDIVQDLKRHGSLLPHTVFSVGNLYFIDSYLHVLFYEKMGFWKILEDGILSPNYYYYFFGTNCVTINRAICRN